MTAVCPACAAKNAFSESSKHGMFHFYCPDCEHRWRESIRGADGEQKVLEECPNCGEGDDRWIYECDECGFVGCYNEIGEEGCFQGDNVIEACPECGAEERTKIGLVGAGSTEEY